MTDISEQPVTVVTGAGSGIGRAMTHAIRGGAAAIAYTASEHGVIGITRNITWAHAADGIRCNAILPGPTMTGMAPTSTPRASPGCDRSSNSTSNASPRPNRWLRSRCSSLPAPPRSSTTPSCPSTPVGRPDDLGRRSLSPGGVARCGTTCRCEDRPVSTPKLWRGQTPQDRSGDRREQLLDVAFDLLGTGGSAAVTMRAVTRQVN